MALSLSSSSSSSRTCLYDVFPSFSGEDVRVTFLSHLLKEFDKKLIIAFKDNEIQRSRSLDPELKQAIKDSRIAVVIFSKKYASSSWCLNELLEIVKCREECGQKVIPVFYGLDPSHVRKQTGEFGKIFEETCMSQTEEETIQWRRALTDVASTLGYHSAKWGNKANMIEEIVKDVMDKLLLTPSKDSENFVGIEDHISEMSILLQLESEEVRMVGLWGSSGIGKTTIARVLFQRLSRHFQSSIFIDRAFISKSMEIFNGAHPDDYNIKLHLQRNFLSEILGKGDIKINHLSAVAERLKHQKVQICIDDLDDQTVLDALVGQTQWFGSGSRIILVTDNKHFLRAHGIGHIYQVCLPSEKIAVEMLCRSAFRKNAAPEGFEELVVKVARLAGRLPLALSVLGSSLRGRDMKYWMDLLPRLQNGIHWNIEKKLRVSYDGLRSEEDKAIFRHIACLFNGVEVAYLKLLLADSGLSVNIVLKNLADKSLIHIREDHVVEMPRLLQEMGRRVVRLEEPEKREFLVDSQDICDVLSEGTGTQKVIGISLDIDEIDELYLHENAFRGMRNLRFVQIHTKRRLEREVKLHLPENFDYLPPKLKLLRWDDYPMRCMPSKFCPENLVELKMENSKLETLWKGIVTLPCLKEVDLSGSQNLIEVPDLSKATNLKTLNLTDCYSLVKLPSSIPHPNKLTTVKMSGCRNLETIPIGISLKSLKYLDLKGCSRLRTFPQISTNIEKLFVSETAIEEFPSDSKLRFENLCSFSMTKLRSKNLWKKVKPVTFLTAIMHPSLRQLRLSDISTLVELPSSFQNLHQLQELVIMNCVNLETLPTETNLMSLEYLNLSGCSRLRAFPDISTNIKKLVLSKTAIEEVPWWIEKFYSLQVLKMNGCNKLKSVSLNISKLKHLWEDGFDLIRGVSPFRRMDIHVDLTNCLNLDQEALFRQNTYFGCQLYLSGEEVPSYFTHRTTGTYLTNIPLPHTFPFQPFFKFKACALVYAESISKYYLPFKIQVRCQFIDRLGNHDYSSPLNITETKLGSHMVLFDCCFPLKKGNVSVAGLNYDHVNIQFHLMSNYSHHLKLKECGIRLPKDSPNFIEQVSEGYRSHKVIFGGHEAVKISSLYNWSYDVFLRFRGEGVRVNLLSYFLRNLDRKQMNVIKDKDMGRGQSLVPSRKKVGEAYEKTCKNRTTKEKTQLRGPLTNAASIPGYQYVTLGDEAKMTEEIGNEVLSKLNLTPSVEQTEMTHNHDAGGSIPEALTDVDGETDGVLWNAKSTVNAKEAESVQGEAKFNERSRKDDSFLGEINSDATFNAQNIIEKKTVEPFKEENKHGKVSESSTMVTNYKHIQEHQVFINFWGEEVRFSFISHLVSALSTEGVNVFIERYEKRGEDGKTLPGIEDSKIALVVFTSRYTESRWCLDELVKIKERMDEGKLLIIPIFYEMEPSQVQQLEGNFGLKLWNLWRIHRDNHIIKWKEALESVAAMKGLCSKEHSSESNFITFIVKKVKEVIRISLLEGENQSFLLSTEKGKTTKMSRLEREKHKSFHDKSPLFGIEKNMRQLEKKLEFDCSETRIIGVVGIAGIGKTTLLTILHEKWTCKFVRSVPLLGIHKKSEHYGLAWLRQTLLVVLLGGKFGVINDKTTHDSLKDKLLQTKVFVVLDDVSNKKQLKFLLGDLTWIKKGSKIVITSCDKSLIEEFVHETYVVPPLNYEEALQLFSNHASGDHLNSMKLCRELVDCAGGNPLVIKLLGKQLHGRDEAQREIRREDLIHFGLVILDIFRYHYDGLSEKQKDVFLDIASFFRSEDDNFVRSLLDSGDHDASDAESEVKDLTHKGVISILGCRVEMHDLLYMFGKIFSSQALIAENGGKSRLLYTPEIIDALIHQKDTKSIRGIFLDMFDVTEIMVLHRHTFINMPNLRYLKIYDSCCPRPCKPVCKLNFPDGLELPLEKVRYLHWEKFPLDELPPDFRPENLVDLRLSYSMIERIWEGVKETPRLKWVDLSYSSKLFNMSALSKAKNLERLNLEGCTNLDELPGEMQNMKSLVYLNMRGCILLSSLPNINLISLKTLILSDCSNFKEFQVISQSLVVLHLDGTAIKGLPQAIQQLERLVLLNLRNCKMLECIPNCLGKLKVLEELILSGCSRLKNLLDVRHNMKHVQILLLDEIGVDEMPKISCFTGSEGQDSVDIVLPPFGSYPSEWPRGFDGVSSLRRLCLSGNDFVSLQSDIGKLYNLTWLDVKQCKKLKCVPMLPPRLEYFDAHGCDLLEKVANPLALLVVEHAHAIFNFSNCNNLDQEAQDSIISYTRRRSQLMLGAQSRYNGDFTSGTLMRTWFPGFEVPKWFSYQSSGPVLVPQLPHWCDSRFTGIALCAVTLSNGYQNQRNPLVVNCNCEFKSNDGSIIYFTCIVGGWSELSNIPQKMESSHVFIGFTSMWDISKHGGYDEEGCFCTISSLEFQVTDGTEKVVGCEVLRCGFSLVYATDEREKICWDAKTVVIPERVKNVPGGRSPLYEDTPTTSNENTIEEINRSSSLHNIPSGRSNTEKLQGVKTFNTDLLTAQHKDVFLDIACFFRSEDEYFIRSLLDSGDPDSPDAVSEVRDLAKEFLITISDGRVETNDELCKDICSRRRLRLWKYKDILDKLMKMKNQEANDVRGIFLDMSEVMQSIAMERMTFINMPSLRYLKIYESCCPWKGESDCKLRFPDGLDFPQKEVRYFHWMKFPLNELPPDFRPENMVDLRLPYSKVERLWKGVKDTPRLKWVDLSHSSKLVNLSGLAKALSLQRLNLEGCRNLNELPREMKNMKSLVYLNMRGCVRLISLPRMNLISLKTLILSDCSNLKEFQVISQSLEVLHLDGTSIKGLPLAIQKLKRLVLLNLKNCKMLESLPNCLGKLKLLEELILSGCSRLKNLPGVRHSMKHVQTLLFDGTGVDEMPDISCFIGSQGQASVGMSCQQFFSYFSPSEWPRSVNGVSSLRRLCLSGHDCVSLHNYIGHLYNLTWLDIKQCTKLRSIPMLPPRLQYFTAHGCDSLESVANPLAIQILTEQIHASFSFSNCNKLDQDATEAIISYTRWKSQMIVDALSRCNGGFTLEASIGTCFPGWEVPGWFRHRASGSVLEANLPPHLCASRFAGVSLSAVILFPSHQHQRNRLLVKCNCVFKSEGGSLTRFSCTVGGWSEPGNMIESPHVFLSFASKLDVRELRKDNEEECIYTEASFEFQVTDGTKELEGYEVMKCGISLVHASDDLQVNSSEHGTTVEKNQDIASSIWVQDLFGYIFLALSCVIVFAVLSFSVIVFAPKYYMRFSDFCWPLLARFLFFVAFGLFLKQDATSENQRQDR